MTYCQCSRPGHSLLPWLTIDDRLTNLTCRIGFGGPSFDDLTTKIVSLCSRDMGLRNADLAHLTGADRGQLSRCIRRLRDGALVCTSGRGIVRLSGRGEAAASCIRWSQRRASELLLRKLSAAERAQFLQLAERILDTVLGPNGRGDISLASAQRRSGEPPVQRSVAILVGCVAAFVKRFTRNQLRSATSLHFTDLRVLEEACAGRLTALGVARGLDKHLSQVGRSIERLERSGLLAHVGRGAELCPTDDGRLLLARTTCHALPHLDPLWDVDDAALLERALVSAREATAATSVRAVVTPDRLPLAVPRRSGQSASLVTGSDPTAATLSF